MNSLVSNASGSIYFCVILLTLSVSACGKASDAEKQDAANIAAGLVNGVGSSSAKGAALTDSGIATEAGGEILSVAQRLKQTAQGAMWLTVFSPELRAQSAFAPRASGVTNDAQAATVSSCSGFSTGGCTSSCSNNNMTWNISCRLPDGGSSTCNGVLYTFKNAVFGFSMDLAGLTGVGESASGTMSFGFNISANVTGGKLEGDELSCSMVFSLDISKVHANTEVFTPLSENFTCSYDGNAISVDELKTKMGATTSCS